MKREAPHFRFWPKGVARELRVPRATLPEYLDVAARRYPDKPAIVYCGAVTTYAQLKQRVDAMAAFLQQRLALSAGRPRAAGQPELPAVRRSPSTPCCAPARSWCRSIR